MLDAQEVKMVDTQEDVWFNIKIKKINAGQLEKLLIKNAKEQDINACLFDVFNIAETIHYFEPPKSGLLYDNGNYIETKIILRKSGLPFANIILDKRKPITNFKVNIGIYPKQYVFDEKIELAKYLKTIEYLAPNSIV